MEATGVIYPSVLGDFVENSVWCSVRVVFKLVLPCCLLVSWPWIRTEATTISQHIEFSLHTNEGKNKDQPDTVSNFSIPSIACDLPQTFQVLLWDELKIMLFLEIHDIEAMDVAKEFVHLTISDCNWGIHGLTHFLWLKERYQVNPANILYWMYW